MKREHRHRIGLLALVAGLFVVAVVIYRHFAEVNPTVSASLAEQAVASFFACTLPDTDGQPRSLAAWQGTPLVINFWATWCPPCRDELPMFSRLHVKYRQNGVQFIGIALDAAESVRDHRAKYPVSYPLLIGGSSGIQLAEQFGNRQLALPYTVVITRRGEVRTLRAGALTEAELTLIIEETLAN